MCKRDFASGASLRTHRSKFHREEKVTPCDRTNLKTGSKKRRMNLDTDKSERRSNVDTKIEKTKTKRKTSLGTENTKKRITKENRSYLPKGKEHHVLNTSYGVHDILKSHLENSKKTYNFIDCYILKHQVFDVLVPYVFKDERNMKEELNEKDSTFVLIVRDLQNLTDIYTVLNEGEYAETIVKIIRLYLEEELLCLS